MTDRINAFIVVLDHDIRDDDAESTINAIKHIKGVLTVTPHVADIDEQIAETRVRIDIHQRLFDALYEKK